MTGTLCRSAALGCIIAPWVVKIAELFGIFVKTILSMVENVGNTLHEPGVCCRKTAWPGLPRAIWPCLSRPASLTLQDAGSLPPSGRRRRITETAGARSRHLPARSPMPWGKVKGFEETEGSPQRKASSRYAVT
jgi:hypothetical protein